jgi:hypothetical protein
MNYPKQTARIYTRPTPKAYFNDPPNVMTRGLTVFQNGADAPIFDKRTCLDQPSV